MTGNNRFSCVLAPKTVRGSETINSFSHGMINEYFGSWYVCFDLESYLTMMEKYCGAWGFSLAKVCLLESCVCLCEWANFLVEINHAKLSSIMITFSSSFWNMLPLTSLCELRFLQGESKGTRRKLFNTFLLLSLTRLTTEMSKQSFVTRNHSNNRRRRRQKFSIKNEGDWSVWWRRRELFGSRGVQSRMLSAVD